jgi:Tfp pilus assembly protein FimT
VEFLIVLAILLVVVAVVIAPLRREWQGQRRVGESDELEPARELAELEAARDAKYGEIRDAELDHQTGKLSDADFEAVDRALRAEAMDLLKAVDEVSERPSGATIEPR